MKLKLTISLLALFAVLGTGAGCATVTGAAIGAAIGSAGADGDDDDDLRDALGEGDSSDDYPMPLIGALIGGLIGMAIDLDLDPSEASEIVPVPSSTTPVQTESASQGTSERQRSCTQECRTHCGNVQNQCFDTVEVEDCKTGRFLPDDPECLDRNSDRRLAACSSQINSCYTDYCGCGGILQ